MSDKKNRKAFKKALEHIQLSEHDKAICLIGFKSGILLSPDMEAKTKIKMLEVHNQEMIEQSIIKCNQLDLAIEALELISNWKDAYPEDIFTPVDNDFYHLICKDAGISVDRVSAHVLRSSVKGFSETADNVLSNIKDNQDSE